MPATAADHHGDRDLRGALSPDRVASPKDGREVPSLGTAKSRTWVKPDGSRVTRIWNRPVNVETPDGWKGIDNSLKASPAGGFLKGEGGYGLRVPSTLAEPLRLRDGDRFIELKLQGSAAAGKVTGTKATFAGAGKGADLELTAFNDAIKEDLILAGADSQTSFTYEVKLSEGLKLELRKDGGADVVDAKGGVAFAIPAPVAQDAKGAIAVDGNAQLTYKGGNLTVSLSKQWLTAKGRAFPVKLDPSAVLGASRDTFTDEIAPTTGYATAGDLFSGREAAGHDHNALTYFNIAGAIPAGANVQLAELGLWPKYETSSTGVKNLEARAITADWDSSATWAKRNATTNWGTAGGDFGGVLDTEPLSAFSWKTFTVTDTVNSWLDGSATNRGIAITDGASTVDRAVAFASSEWTDAAARPYLEVNYFPRAGALPNSTIQSQAISDRQTLGVNVAGGNLILQSQDLQVAAKGLPVSIGRTYNSLDDWTGQFGQGGRISLGNDIVLYECDGLGSRCLIGPSGYRVRFKYNGTATYQTPADVGNLTLKRATATSGAFTLTDNTSGTKWNFFDNSFSFNNQITDRYGNSLTFEASNPYGSLSKITDANNRSYPIETDSDGRITKVTVPTSQFSDPVVWQYGYNPYGFLTSVTDPAGKVTQYQYSDANDKLVKIIDGRSNETAIAYDADNRVTSVTRVVDGSTGDVTTTYAYPAVDSACNKTSGGPDPAVVGKTIVTDPRGKATTYCYTQGGTVVKAINAKGIPTDTKYTQNGNVETIKGFAGTANALTTYAYGSNNFNVSSVTGGAGEVSTATYMPASSTDPLQEFRVDEVTDPQGKITNYDYDTAGNVSKVRNTTGSATGTQSVEMNWNANGTLNWSKDGRGNQTSYTYDGLGRLTTVTPANSVLVPPTTYTYDGLSRVKTVTDGRGKTSTFNYDKLDRITSVVDNGLITQAFGFDANGNNVNRSEPGKITSYVYDKLNRRTSETFPGSVTNSYTWDKSSNLKTLTDASGTATYSYDDLNRTTSLNAPAVSGNDTTTFDYTDPTASALAVVTQTLPGNGTIRTALDLSGKIREVLVKNNNASQTLRRTYAWTKTSTGSQQHTLLDSSTEQAAGGTAVVNKSYEYDASGQLTEAKTMDASFAQTAKDSFIYDAAGNRINRTRVNGSATSYLSYAYNANNQLCWRSATNVANPTCGSGAAPGSSVPSGATTFTYDGSGNQLTGDTAMTYDDKGRLASLGGSSTTHLTPSNWELSGLGTTSFRNNMLGISSINTAGNIANIQRSVENGAAVSQVRDSVKRWFVQDQIGSTIALIDSTGTVQRNYAYDVDGNDTTSGFGPQTAIKFAGGHDVGNGTYHFGLRYYQPSTARWTQTDPKPQYDDFLQANRYGYAGGCPTSYVDSTGQDIFDVIGCAAAIGGAVVSGVFTVTKLAKVRKAVKAAGGVRKAAEEIIASKGKIEALEKGAGALAPIIADLAGVTAIKKACFD